MNDFIALVEQIIVLSQQYADELSDEESKAVADFIAMAMEFIEAEQAQENAPIQAATPEVPAGPYPSSNVNGFNYNPDTGELLVQFHGPYPKAEGPIYKYGGVPKFIYDVFAKGAVGPKTSGSNRYHTWIKGVTPSLGGSLNALIKAGGFQYQKLS